jgi:VWFA-related protein
LLKYLSDSVDPNALVSLIMINRGGVKVIHDFTTDPAILSAALKKVRGMTGDVETIDQITPEESDPALQAEVDDLTAFQQGQTDAIAEQKRMAIMDTLGAMQQIALRYAGVNGRKALIWVTAGFPFSIDGTGGLMTGRASTSAGLDDILPEYEHVWTLFNAANIAVYPVDVRGLENPASMDASARLTSPRSSTAPRQIAQHQDSLDTFRSFAEMTGGKAFYDTNDLAKSFREATLDSASYYMLGYYLESNAKPGWHTLKVSVHHASANARSRDGFFVEANETRTREKDLAQALTSPMDFTAIPLTLHWEARVQLSNSSKTKVSFNIELPPNSFEVNDSENNHVSFDVLAVAKSPEGTPEANAASKIDAHLKADSATKAHEKGMTVSDSLQLAKGSYTVRVVVLDNLTGKIGSVSAPIEVQ